MSESDASNADSSLEDAISRLRQEKEASERDFGNKRALFKKMYMDKEAELTQMSVSLQNCQVEKDALQRQVEELKAELGDVKTAAAVSEVGRQDEISLLRSHYQDEVASLQHIVRESVAEAVEKASAKYAEAKKIWTEEKRELQARLDEVKRQGWQEKEAGVLDVFAKTFRRMTHSQTQGIEIPTEGVLTSGAEDGEEASSENLEEAMRRAQADVDALKSIVMPYEEEIFALKQKVREAYAQIDALEEHELKRELDRSRREIDVERGNVAALRAAWQRDNDQFLQQQRCQLGDLRRMEGLLTEEQKSQLASLTARENKAREESSRPSPSKGSSPGSPDSGRAGSGGRRSLSNQDLRSEVAARRSSPSEVRSLFEFSANGDDFFGSGLAASGGAERVVSEREWTLLQQEVTNARRRLARPCEMCGNYEDQLQTLQGNFSEKDKKLRLVQGQLEKAQKDNLDLRTCISDLESRIAQTAGDHSDRIQELMSLLQEKESSLTALRSDFTQYKVELDAKLDVLFAERQQLNRECSELQREHSSLLDRHREHSRRLQAENLELPRNIDDLHVIVLQLREELIAGQSAREHMEAKLRGEINFMRDQMKAEFQEKANLEASMQEELARAHSLQSEFDRESKVRASAVAELDLLRAEVADLTRKQEAAIAEASELRAKNANLSSDLSTAEEVQKDFVRLSQSLQIQLEHLRQEERSIRWQEKRETTACGDCATSFEAEAAPEKRRCKHCARVFCPKCCAKSVLSRGGQRALPVCSVCHTLLVRDAVPFFSQSLPENQANS